MNVSGERTKSLWMQTKVFADAPALEGQLTCDTVIVGSGIAGLSAAYELAAVGQKVIVVDRGPIAGGMTARTTAHLAPICDDGISGLIDLRGVEMARLFQQSQAAAVDRIEAIVRQHDIACDFRRLDGHLFPAIGTPLDEARKQIDREFEAARQAGVVVERGDSLPLTGLGAAPVLRYPGQATFHPLKYLAAIAEMVLNKSGRLFADSPVMKVEHVGRAVRVTTESGASVTADRAIVATNVPINNRVEIHSKMAPYRTYAMAFSLPSGSLPDALYWDMADPYHYVRLELGADSDRLIVGGADHKSGEANDGERRFAALEGWIRELVPALGQETHRWSGQVMNTIDYCGFIGRNPNDERIFIATGDSGQGMTHGALAGPLLKDLIVAGKSPWEEVYEPVAQAAQGGGDVCQRKRHGAEELRRVCPSRRSQLGRSPGAGRGRPVDRRPAQARRLSRSRGQAPSALGGLHPSRLPRELERDGAVLGLPLPRLAVRARRCRAERPGPVAVGRSEGEGEATGVRERGSSARFGVRSAPPSDRAARPASICRPRPAPGSSRARG